MELAALVVDDDPTARILLSKILEREGFSVDVASDGTEALARLHTRGYAIIFLDLMMPNVDGISVLRTLNAERPDLLSRVVVITGYLDQLFPVRDAVCKVIAKPFYTETILNAVSHCLGIQ